MLFSGCHLLGACLNPAGRKAFGTSAVGEGREGFREVLMNSDWAIR